MVQLVDLSDSKKYDDLVINGLHVTPAALFKFDLPNIFPELDKILYIDGDVLIKDDLYALYDVDINDVYAAVVRDRGAFFYYGKNLHDRLGIDQDDYFNTGMIVLNLKKMREEHIPDKLMAYRRQGKNDFMDQDAFNVVFGSCVKYVSLKYNGITSAIRYADIAHINRWYPEEAFASKEELFDKAVIWHFASPEKPWKYTNVEHRTQWLEAYSRSVFRDVPLECTVFDFEKRDAEISRIRNIVGNQYEHVRLSIVIPVYNGEAFIGTCLDSIIGQKDVEDFEVICIDDGSTDNTYLILERYRRRDPRIRIFSQNNLYAGAARNKGIAEAKGDYITFIDADDMLASGKALKKSLEAAYQQEADIVCCNAAYLSADGKKGGVLGWNLKFQYVPENTVFSVDSLKENAFFAFGGAPWGRLHKKSFLLDYHITFPLLKRSEDFYFVQVALLQAARITARKDVLIYHRDETGSNLEAGKDETPLIFWEGDKLFFAYLTENHLYDQYETAAKLVALNRYRYNLLAMKSYEGYKTVYEAGKKEILPYLAITADDVSIPPYIQRTVEDVTTSGSAEELLYRLWQSSTEAARLKVQEEQVKNRQYHDDNVSYRIGRMITFMPRKLRGGIRCYQDHGLTYTVKRMLYHFGLYQWK